MHIGNKIREIIRKKEISAVDLAQMIDMTKQHVYYIFEKPHINTELLEKICGALEVPIKHFFIEPTEEKVEEDLTNKLREMSQKMDLLNDKIKHLSEIIETKDKLLKSNEERLSERDERITELKNLLLIYDKVNNLLSK